MDEVFGFTGLVVVILVYLCLERFFPCHLTPETQAIFTMEDLERYDGRTGETYTACNGLVFDISNSPYANPHSLHYLLKGKDASLALATMNFTSSRLLSTPPSLHSLTEKTKQNLREWTDVYRKRYHVVGKMDYAEN